MCVHGRDERCLLDLRFISRRLSCSFIVYTPSALIKKINKFKKCKGSDVNVFPLRECNMWRHTKDLQSNAWTHANCPTFLEVIHFKSFLTEF